MKWTFFSRISVLTVSIAGLAGCSIGATPTPAKQTAEQICAGEPFNGDPTWGRDFYVGSTFSGNQDPLLNAAGITGFCAAPGMPNLGNTAYVIVVDSTGQIITPAEINFANSVYSLSVEESTWNSMVANSTGPGDVNPALYYTVIVAKR